MRTLYIHENYYFKDHNSGIYSAAQFPYSYWEAYLKHFDKLGVVGRDAGHISPENTKKYNLSNGKAVRFHLLPNLSSPLDFLKKRTEVKKELSALIDQYDSVILRNANEFTWLAFHLAKQKNKPIAVEMTGCQWDAMWHYPKAIAKFYAPIRYLQARRLAENCNQIIYVSERFLQKRYPSKAYQTHASNVRLADLSPNTLKKRLNKIKEPKKPFRLGLIGALHHGLKGIPVAIKALEHIIKQESDLCRLHILGDGDTSLYHPLIRKCSLEQHVFFDGTLPSGEAVQEWLDQIDIYLQPSFHEGVPRATIEAMARGCPALGSTAGGIPELLSSEHLHNLGNSLKLSHQIKSFIQNKALMGDAAETNFTKAQEYKASALETRRDAFWAHFKNL